VYRWPPLISSQALCIFLLYAAVLLDQMCVAIEDSIDKEQLRDLWRKFKLDADDIYLLETEYKGKTMLKARVSASLALW